MVTIKKIAEIAGVSRGTVDRVLNNRPGVNAETYHKVKEIADKLGYEPNMAGQMLAARKKKIRLGFIVCDTPVDLFFADVYRAARRIMNRCVILANRRSLTLSQRTMWISVQTLA